MNPESDAEPFTRLLETVCEFYDQTVSAARSTMFFGALQQYDFQIVVAAFNRHIQTSKFAPKPADIREIIEGTELERDANIWNALGEAIRRVGVWQSVIVQDPELAAAIIRTWGSWVACCEFNANADPILWNSKRKDFVAAYRLALKNPQADREPILLSGYCDQQNRMTGFLPRRQSYGAILLDGKVETRYLPVNKETGLPALTLAAALLEPQRLALAAFDEGETANNAPVIPFEHARPMIEEAVAGIRTFPAATQAKGAAIDPDAARRAELHEQAKVIHADTVSETGQALRDAETEATGQSDRASDLGGGPAEAGDGIPVREGDAREKLGGGLRMAGDEDHSRSGGRGIRASGSRGHRRVDDKKSEGRKGPRRSRTKRNRKSGRKT